VQVAESLDYLLTPPTTLWEMRRVTSAVLGAWDSRRDHCLGREPLTFKTQSSQDAVWTRNWAPGEALDLWAVAVSLLHRWRDFTYPELTPRF